MSYDIELTDPVTGEVLHIDEPHRMTGGTYAMGGTTALELNITHNYCDHFMHTLGDHGIRAIYGMSGAESIPLLDNAIAQLGDDVSENYWDATEGNAKRALCHLRAMAYMRPDGVWKGD